MEIHTNFINDVVSRLICDILSSFSPSFFKSVLFSTFRTFSCCMKEFYLQICVSSWDALLRVNSIVRYSLNLAGILIKCTKRVNSFTFFENNNGKRVFACKNMKNKN